MFHLRRRIRRIFLVTFASVLVRHRIWGWGTPASPRCVLAKIILIQSSCPQLPFKSLLLSRIPTSQILSAPLLYTSCTQEWSPILFASIFILGLILQVSTSKANRQSWQLPRQTSQRTRQLLLHIQYRSLNRFEQLSCCTLNRLEHLVYNFDPVPSK